MSACFQVLGFAGSGGIQQLFEVALLLGGEAGQDPLIGHLHRSVGSLQQSLTAAGELGWHCPARRRRCRTTQRTAVLERVQHLVHRLRGNVGAAS